MVVPQVTWGIVVVVTIWYSAAPPWYGDVEYIGEAIRVYPDAAVSVVDVPVYPAIAMIRSLALEVENAATFGVPVEPVFDSGKPVCVSNGVAVLAPVIP